MTSHPRLTAAGLAAAFLVSLAACGSAATSGSPSSSTPGGQSGGTPSAGASLPGAVGSVPDAASLVTADMAASIIGGSPTKVTPPISLPTMSVASYRNDNGDTVTVFVETVPGGLANAQLQAAIAVAGAQGDLQPVSGIGDAAGKVVATNEATVAFVKGSTLVVVQGSSGTTAGSDLEPKVESVAGQVAGKL
ncbi:MAG: hypothetical protein ACXWQ6_02045 [Candidatus Limnocylindrales bacterium]